MKNSNKKFIFTTAVAIICIVAALTTLCGCNTSGYLTEEEQVIKKNSMLLSLSNFKFGKYTCTGADPKFIINIDPSTPYYVLPMADEIEVPLGTEYHIYLGEPYMQPLRPAETIDVPAGSVRTISIVLESEGQEIIVRGMAVNLGDNPVPYYIGLPNIEGVHYYNGDHKIIDIRADVYPTVGSDYKFMIGLEEAYSKSVITVYANGNVLQPDENSIYTISQVSEDVIITIEGVTLNEENNQNKEA